MRLIRLPTVLDKTGLCRSVVYDLIARGAFPKPAKPYSGARSNVWPEPEIDDYIQARLTDREAA